MPLKRVYHWQPNLGTSVNSQLLNEFSQCAESFNGVRDGRWKPNLSLYRPIPREQAMPVDFPRDFLGVMIPEQPSKYYLVIRSQRLVTEADSTIQVIMEKLQSYKARMSFTFEGIQYQMGDFSLRVGKVVPTHSENLRGIVMEVEYAPISSIEKGRVVMDDFFDIWQEALSKRSLPGHFSHIDTNFSEFGLSDNYTPQHTALQYACVMVQMISTAQTIQAARN